jgi:hypothetical protein
MILTQDFKEFIRLLNDHRVDLCAIHPIHSMKTFSGTVFYGKSRVKNWRAEQGGIEIN